MTPILFVLVCGIRFGGSLIIADTITSIAPPSAWERTTEYRERTRLAVEHVLADPEFGGRSADSFGERFLEWLLWIFKSFGNVVDGLPGWFYWMVLIWLVLALLAILAHILYVVTGLFGGRSGSHARGSKFGVEGYGELFGIRGLEPDTIHDEAMRLLAAEDWLAATKYLYVAAILRLDRAGQINFAHAKTNHDYIAELSRHPHHQLQFRDLTRHFESTVYGGRPATEAACKEMMATVEELHRDRINAQN